MFSARLLIASFASVSFLLLLGCGGDSKPTESSPPPPSGTSMTGPPSGNTVFDTKCLNCHGYSADAPPRPGAPNLAKIGSKQKADWIADHIKDPKSHKPDSKMPEFGSKLKPEELKSVTDFVAGLK